MNSTTTDEPPAPSLVFGLQQFQSSTMESPRLDDSSTGTETSLEFCTGHSDPFPVKLHKMLDDIEREGLHHIISWNPDGKTFTVHKTKVFAEQIMGRFFNQTKYKSFQRQLNIYNFERLSPGKGKAHYKHDYFVRGNRGLCHLIRRGRNQSHVPVTRQVTSTSPANIQPQPGVANYVGSSDTATSGTSNTAQHQPFLGIGGSRGGVPTQFQGIGLPSSVLSGAPPTGLMPTIQFPTSVNSSEQPMNFMDNDDVTIASISQMDALGGMDDLTRFDCLPENFFP
eukprot:Nitzschia sp. Nitz4//scaffold210_size37948//2222//3141//NITZ4_007684-RA/size37948-augustus-gene-0.21-mRNA-1//-1//CDS//3329541912//4819//frame0